MAPNKRAGGGKKSFLKGVSRGDEPDAAAAPSDDPQELHSFNSGSCPVSDSPAQPPAPADPPAARASATETQATAVSGAETSVSGIPLSPNTDAEGADEASGGSGGGETRGQMLQRHKKEAKAMKETVKKMGKKRKDESAALEGGMESRHVAELSQVQARMEVAAQEELQRQADAGEAVVAEEEDAVAAALAGNSLYAKTAAAEHQESSRAQKRKQKAVAQGAEREARIAAELAEAGDSERKVEEAALLELLLPLGFAVRDIQPDGNCMYRAVEDQLRLHSSAHGTGPSTHSTHSTALSSHPELRQMAVDHMREQESSFLPFFAQEEEGDDEVDDAHERFQEYCTRMSEAASWGGQMELRALAQCLRRRIDVFLVGLPTVLMGEEFGGEPLRVCYLRHAYGMGEHYNSIAVAAGSEQEGR